MFKRLPFEENLTDRILLELVFSTQPDTRQRKHAVMVANALAKFAGIDPTFRTSKYSSKRLRVFLDFAIAYPKNRDRKILV